MSGDCCVPICGLLILGSVEALGAMVLQLAGPVLPRFAPFVVEWHDRSRFGCNLSLFECTSSNS